MRALALTYVAGMDPVKPRNGGEAYRGLTWNGYPGVGEYFCCNALTTTGPCEIMIFEGLPGGPMDCWAEVKTPEEHLEKSLCVLETFFPWEADRSFRIRNKRLSKETHRRSQPAPGRESHRLPGWVYTVPG